MKSKELCLWIDGEIARLPEQLRPQAERIREEIQTTINATALDVAEEHESHRRTAREMYHELNDGFALVAEKGRGVVYFGSARTNPGEAFYEDARELGREIFLLLRSTSWSGAGPGQMQAALEGAKEVGGPIAGVKIRLEEHQAAKEQKISPVFDSLDEVVVCDHFDPRKTVLTDAGWPEQQRQEHGAFVFLPGAAGTLDEFFEICVLQQLKKVGRNKRQLVPIILMNYDNFYYHLLQQLQMCVSHEMIGQDELDHLFRACETNEQALDFLADFYHIPAEQRNYKGHLRSIVDPEASI
ncbi:MAG: LOG family protein [Candidatus Peribacteraceae bacterium]|nr:LOG family protein [Candidatus Peribacteraceae bacterium]MDD5074467.1 LOG family protein [Candidatus Peribacteraceae bacterium]